MRFVESADSEHPQIAGLPDLFADKCKSKVALCGFSSYEHQHNIDGHTS